MARIIRPKQVTAACYEEAIRALKEKLLDVNHDTDVCKICKSVDLEDAGFWRCDECFGELCRRCMGDVEFTAEGDEADVFCCKECYIAYCKKPQR